MPSIQHQALAELFRDDPGMCMTVFRGLARRHAIDLPEGFTLVRDSAQFTDLAPPEYAAEAVFHLRDGNGRSQGALIVEIQLSKDAMKHASWLNYTGTLHRSLKAKPVTVLVVTTTPEMAAWCARPRPYNHLGDTFRPLVLGPDYIPRITEIDEAKSRPSLAVLSVAAHGHSPDASAIGIAAYLAATTLDGDRRARYADSVLAWLDEGARRALEEYLDMNGYQFQSDFAKYHNDLGRKDGVVEGIQFLFIELLQDKFGPLDEPIHQRIEAADREQIVRWGRRVLIANSVDEVFDAAPQ